MKAEIHLFASSAHALVSFLAGEMRLASASPAEHLSCWVELTERVPVQLLRACHWRARAVLPE